jgi:hypothetical protein
MTKRNVASWPKPLEVVFLTNFSDPCFRTIPAIAQMSDDIALNLTVVHAYDEKRNQRAQAETSVHSFFPEADRYGGTRRLAMAGTPLDVLKRVAQCQPIDLVVCPASDLMGLPRPGHQSLRARILRELGVPVWTIGRNIDPARVGKAVRNVACWVDFEMGEVPQLTFAAEYAVKLNARLHLFYRMQEINEGLILPMIEERPLHPDGVRQFVQSKLGETALEPVIHVTSSGSRSAQAALARAHDVDLFFTNVSAWGAGPLVASGFRGIDRFTCPAICVGRRTKVQPWKLEPGPAFRKWDAGTLEEMQPALQLR